MQRAVKGLPSGVPGHWVWLPYRFGGYGDWLNYQGPFIVRYQSATGSEHATFDVPDAALSGVWERAHVNADSRVAP